MNAASILVAAVAIAAVFIPPPGATTLATGTLSDGTSGDVSSWESWPWPADRPFDPIVAGLGITTEEEFAALNAAQRQVALELGDGPGVSATLSEDGLTDVKNEPSKNERSERSRAVSAAQDALWLAIDELYAEAAATQMGSEARAGWNDCMAALGTPAASPEEVEQVIVRGLVNGSTEGVASDHREISANRDICNDEANEHLQATVIDLFPEWRVKHETTFDRYSTALGV